MSDDALKQTVASRIQAYRNGEDPELSALLETLWRALYDRIPDLTRSKHKDDQHEILAKHLEELGIPHGADLRYVAGPMLWFGRERGVIPPAQAAGLHPEPWILDRKRYEAMGAALGEGLVAYGDWMRDALRTLLFEQQ